MKRKLRKLLGVLFVVFTLACIMAMSVSAASCGKSNCVNGLEYWSHNGDINNDGVDEYFATWEGICPDCNMATETVTIPKNVYIECTDRVVRNCPVVYIGLDSGNRLSDGIIKKNCFTG